MRKYLIRTLLGVAAVVAAGFAATSCSDDSDSGSGVFRVEWDPTKTVHPDREGAAVLIVDGREGTSWRAEITAGADWVSFTVRLRAGRPSRPELPERASPPATSMSITGRTTPGESGMP